MEIKDDHFYPIKEAVILTKIKHRTLTRKASTMGAKIIDGRYLLTGKQVKFLIVKQQEKKAYLDRLDRQALDKLDKNDENSDNILAPDDDQDDDQDDGTVTETFTAEEHEQLQKLVYNEPLKKDRLEELVETIQDYRNQIAYLSKSLDKKDEQMTLLIHSIKESLDTIKETQKNMQQRNFLEAKEKGFDKK